MQVTTKRWAVLLFFAVLLSSKFSYWHGFNTGSNEAVDKTDKVCSAWWFNGDQRRINQAKMWMCRK